MALAAGGVDEEAGAVLDGALSVDAGHCVPALLVRSSNFDVRISHDHTILVT